MGLSPTPQLWEVPTMAQSMSLVGLDVHVAQTHAAQCASPPPPRGHAYCALVIARSVIVDLFRKEWPAGDGHPRQAAGDRIVAP